MGHRVLSSCLIACLLLGVNGVAQTAAAPTSQSAIPSVKPAVSGFVLEDGTPIRLRLNRNLSSADSKKGDEVDFEVLEDVSVQNIVVIPRGSLAFATITEAEHKKSMGRGGKLDVNIDYVRLRDGEKVALRAIKEGSGGGHVGAMTGAIVATSIVFFPAAPLFLFVHGKDMAIPKGTEITGYVNGNVTLDRARFAEHPVETAVATPASQNTVSITSNVTGADIEADGSFVGSAPSQIALPAGEHVIKVSKTGYKPWERKIKISGGNVTLSADLEKIVAGN